MYGETVRDRMIAIPDSVHDWMKEASLKTDRPLYELYTEAARQFLKAKGVAGQVEGVGNVSAEEQEIIADVLQLWRSRKKSRVADETLNAIRLLVSSSQVSLVIIVPKLAVEI
jgi:hypothetical protein